MHLYSQHSYKITCNLAGQLVYVAWQRGRLTQQGRRFNALKLTSHLHVSAHPPTYTTVIKKCFFKQKHSPYTPDYPFSIPESHIVKRELAPKKLPSDLHMNAVACTPPNNSTF